VRGLLIGRFQPFHAGHLAVVRDVRRTRPEAPLLLVIGSAEQSFTRENPFSAGERVEMIERALREAGLDGVSVIPVADIQRHALWVRYLEGLLPPFDRVYTNNPLTRLLFEQAGYAVESPPLVERERFEGARLRDAMAEGRPWKDCVPPSVARYLDEIGGPARLKLLRAAPPAGRADAAP
jgi:nicotinamide-nucleotide adenylyltransferase